MNLLRIGDNAPDLKVKGILHAQVGEYSLGASKGKWLVLFFYPGIDLLLIRGLSEPNAGSNPEPPANQGPGSLKARPYLHPKIPISGRRRCGAWRLFAAENPRNHVGLFRICLQRQFAEKRRPARRFYILMRGKQTQKLEEETSESVPARGCGSAGQQKPRNRAGYRIWTLAGILGTKWSDRPQCKARVS